MIICPNCHHEEINGAIYCGECGAPLVNLERIQTHLIGDVKGDTQEFAKKFSGAVEEVQNSPISLLLIESGQMLHLAGRVEYSLGRSVEEQPILPDVDLTPYDAYTMGVSRLHAVLKWIDQKTYIMDLGSSNGTRINGEKILPKIDFPVQHGDIITLGRLKLQLFIHVNEEVK